MIRRKVRKGTKVSTGEPVCWVPPKFVTSESRGRQRRGPSAFTVVLTVATILVTGFVLGVIGAVVRSTAALSKEIDQELADNDVLIKRNMEKIEALKRDTRFDDGYTWVSMNVSSTSPADTTLTSVAVVPGETTLTTPLADENGRTIGTSKFVRNCRHSTWGKSRLECDITVGTKLDAPGRIEP